MAQLILFKRINKLILALFLAVGLHGGAVAHAQAKKPSKADYKKAETLFNEAELLYKAGEYKAALEKYKQAYLLSHESGILFNMGQCYRYLGQKEDALKTYKYFLDETPEISFRADVEKIIKELEEPEPQPTSAPTSLKVEPTTQPTTAPTSTPAPPDIKPDPIKTPTTSPEPKTEAKLSKRSKQLFIVAGATGLSAAGLGFAAFSSAEAAQSLSQVQSPNILEIDEILLHRRKAILRGALSDIFFVGAAACTAGAIFSPREQVTISLSLNGLSLQGQF